MAAATMPVDAVPSIEALGYAKGARCPPQSHLLFVRNVVRHLLRFFKDCICGTLLGFGFLKKQLFCGGHSPLKPSESSKVFK